MKKLQTEAFTGSTLNAVKSQALACANEVTARGDRFIRVECKKCSHDNFIAWVDWTHG